MLKSSACEQLDVRGEVAITKEEKEKVCVGSSKSMR